MLWFGYFSEHAAIGTNGVFAVLTVVGHFYAMLITFFLHFLVALHGGQQMFDVVDKSLAIGKATEV